MGEAHIGHEWDSTRESTSKKDEKVATIAIHKSSPTLRLFNNISDDDYYSPHICLMAKREKVKSKSKAKLLHLLVISLVVILVIALVMMNLVLKK